MNPSSARSAESSTSLPLIVWLALLGVIFAAATGPIVIREAQLFGLSSIFIITLRQVLTVLAITPLILRNHLADLRQLTARQWRIALFAGVFFTFNLLALFFALEYTSVLMTGILRRTSVLWTFLLEATFLHVAFTRNVKIGVAATLFGGLIVFIGSLGGETQSILSGQRPLLGALIALGGALSMATYLSIGRAIRNSIPFLLYSWIVFSVTGLLTFIVGLFVGIPFTGYSAEAWRWIFIVTFITQFFGHIGINFSLKYVNATYMSVILQVAVVMSAIIAFFLYREVPTPLQIAGSVAIILGIFLVQNRSR